VPFFRIQIELSVRTVIPRGLTVVHEVVDHYCSVMYIVESFK
jgi:hypothetical protein